MGKRIFQYPEVTELAEDDYIMIDSETDDTRCILASKIAPTVMSKTVTERKVYSASEDGVKGYSSVSVEVPFTNVIDLEGDIVTFDDGEDLPLASLKTTIVPIQDLHGYDSPWVGGSGRNLFNMGSKWNGTASGLTFTTDDDYVTINNTKNGGNYVTPSQLYFDLPAGTYYAKAIVISGTASNAPSVYVYSNQELTSNMLNTERNFTLESQTSVGIRFAFWNDGATYSNYKIGIVISKTANIDKFYPYSNICPISGWSAVDVTIQDDIDNPTTTETITIQLGSTYYGGKLDVVSGVLKDIFENGTIDIGEQTFTYNSTSKTFYLRLLNSKEYTSAEVANAISSAFKCVANNAMSDLTLDNCFSIHKEAGSVWLNIRCLAYSDATNFANAMSGQTLMYEVASPTTIQLTPTEVKSLLGSNNVWCDTGNVIEANYIRCLDITINDLISRLEG